MAYATVSDAQLLYGEAQIAVVCDRNLDGELDTESFERHLAAASSQMDMFLLGRYPLPLTFIPAYFVQACVDIAIANATPTADVATTEIGKRRDNALSLMKMIARNEVKLETSEQATSANASASAQIHSPAASCCAPVYCEGARIFTDRNLKDIL